MALKYSFIAVLAVIVTALFLTRSVVAAEYAFIKSISNPGTTSPELADTRGGSIVYQVSFLPFLKTKGLMYVKYETYGMTTNGEFVLLSSKLIQKDYNPIRKPTISAKTNVDTACVASKYYRCAYVAKVSYDDLNPSTIAPIPDQHWGYYLPYKR